MSEEINDVVESEEIETEEYETDESEDETEVEDSDEEEQEDSEQDDLDDEEESEGDKKAVKSKPKEDKKESQKIKLKTKVDGKEVEEELELEAIQRDYQKFKAADKKFQEAAAMRKQAEEFISLLKTNPAQVLAHPSIGLDVRKLAEEYLAEQLQYESLTPEQRKAAEDRKRLEEYEKREQEAAKQAHEEKINTLKAKYTEDYNKTIIDALESAGLPKNKSTVKMMAQKLYLSVNNGLDLDAKDLAESVRQDYINAQKELFAELDGEALIKILGDDVAEKVRKYNVSKIKNSSASDNSNPVRKTKKKQKQMTYDEYRKYLESL